MKALPHLPEAELAVIGSVLIGGAEVLAQAAELLCADDFYQPRAAAVWQAMRLVAERGEPIDVITLEAQLRRTGQLELVGGIAGLARMDAHATAHHVQAHARLLLEVGRRRRLLVFGRELAEELAAEDVEDLDEVVARRGAEYSSLADTGRLTAEPWPVSRVLDDTFAEMVDEAGGRGRGVPTGFPVLDRLLKRTGPRAGWLLVIGGRPKMGKTTAALSITRAAHFARLPGHPVSWRPADRPAPVLWACDEMRAVDLVQRQLADLTSLDGRSIGAPTSAWLRRHLEELAAARRLLDGSPLHFVPDADSHYLDRIFRYARRWRSRHAIVGRVDGKPVREPAVLVLDYLQRFGDLPGLPKHASQSERVGSKAKLCKTMAQELGIVVLLLSQLNRQLEVRENKRPILSDFRDSGEIEQEADALIGCYRDIVYDREADAVRHNVAALTRRSSLHPGDLEAVLAYHGGEEHPPPAVLLARTRCELTPAELEALVVAKRRITAAELIVIANRHGPAGTVYTDFEGAYFRFLPRSDHEPSR